MLAHPFDDGSSAVVHRSVDETARGLGGDAAAYHRVIGDIVNRWNALEDAVLGPLRWPRHPFQVARFGLRGLGSAEHLVRGAFADERTRALIAGVCAHGMLPL